VPVVVVPQFLNNSSSPNQGSSFANYADMREQYEQAEPGKYYLDRFSHVTICAGLARYKTLGNMTRLRLGMELNAGYLVQASSLIAIGFGEYGYNRSVHNYFYR